MSALIEAAKKWSEAYRAAKIAIARLREAESALVKANDKEECANKYQRGAFDSPGYRPVPRYNPPGSGLVEISVDRIPATTGVVTYSSPATNVPENRRMGCACPPGTTSAMCPEANCPWKPR